VIWDTFGVYKYTELERTYIEHEIPGIGLVLAGVEMRFKFYKTSNSNGVYIIFDLKAVVFAAGATDVGATPIESSNNGWTHIVEELNWNQVVEGTIEIWADGMPWD
jgi:hypothetical protein